MTDSLQEQPEKPKPVLRLGDALWGQDEDDISHDECRTALPQFVEAEVAGEDAAALYPRVQRHLDHCEECGEEYALMVDLEMVEQAGMLELPAEASVPAFTYEQARTPDLQMIVIAWTRQLFGILTPGNAGDVDRAAETFFAALKPRQANEARAEYGAALGIGKPQVNPAFATLAAGYAVTQDLTAHVSQQQFDEWLAQNTLGAELETRAETTARGIGLEPKPACDFARAFAQVVGQEPERLRGLLSE